MPVGRSPAIDANPLIAGYKDFSVAADLLGSCELSQSIGGLAAAGRGCGCSNARNSCDRAYGATANGSCTANEGGIGSRWVDDRVMRAGGVRWVFLGRFRQLIAPLIAGLSIMPFSTYQVVAMCL